MSRHGKTPPSMNTSVADGHGQASEPTIEVEEQIAENNQNIKKGGVPMKKRKAMGIRAEIWGHYDKKMENDKVVAGYCKYCREEIKAVSAINGTSGLHNHFKTCKRNPFRQTLLAPNDESQSVLNYQPNSLTTWRFDKEKLRNEIAKLFVKGELPFRFVESKAWKDFIAAFFPTYHMFSRHTTQSDCMGIYRSEKEKMKKFLEINMKSVCLTTDTWTTKKQANYMCLTAHFIDNDWKLCSKILNFTTISSHRGEAIGMDIEQHLREWGIEKVFSITLDNASSNDKLVAYVKRKINSWDGNVIKCKYLHLRCAAHIINLIVQEGFKLLSASVVRVRDAVRYIKASGLRKARFVDCALKEKLADIGSQVSIPADCPTRWNSTYLMLKAALKYQKAFERFEAEDPQCLVDLRKSEEDKGMPDENDWEHVGFFPSVAKMMGKLKEMSASTDSEIKRMAAQMMEKCDKYWGDHTKLNFLIFAAGILDPSIKMLFIEYHYNKVYSGNVATKVIDGIKAELFAMYHEYEEMHSGSTPNMAAAPQVGPSGAGGHISDEEDDEDQEFLKFKSSKGEAAKSDLVRYLDEPTERTADVLDWWKKNAARFPILSLMARDILAVPVTSVASVSVFSTGGRVIGDFRSSLAPHTLQALVCAQNWLRGSEAPPIEGDNEDEDDLLLPILEEATQQPQQASS